MAMLQIVAVSVPQSLGKVKGKCHCLTADEKCERAVE